MNQLLRSPGARWALFGTTGLVIFALLFLYIGGHIFHMLIGLKADDAKLLTLYQYWYYYGDMPAVKSKLSLASVLTVAALSLPVFLAFKGSRPKQHGDARFANINDIKKAGLMADYGIILGKFKGKFVVLGGMLHAIVRARTRGGKGVGLVIPNAMSYPGSFVGNDPKLEIWRLTSKHRERYGHKCYLFSPLALDFKTHRWNPLAYIRSDWRFRIDDCQRIASYIFPDVPGVDPIWTGSGRSLLVGTVLYLIETPGMPVTFGEVYRLVTQGEEAGAFFARVMAERIEQGNPLSDECMSSLNDFVATSLNTRNSIRKTFTARFEIWLNPLIDAATSGNDFDFRQLRREKISIYVGVAPGDLQRLGPVLNLFWQQLTNLNTDVTPDRDPSLNVPVLLLADEMAAMGKVPAIEEGSSYLAGYGISLLPIFQNESQVVKIYGEHAARTFDSNMHAEVFFSPDDLQLSKNISERLGYQTWKVRSFSNPRTWGKGNKTESLKDDRRALMLPQEVQAIGDKKQFIFAKDTPAIFCDKIRFYEEEAFIGPMRELSPTLQALGYNLGLKFLGPRMPKKKHLDAVIASGELAAHVPELQLRPRAASKMVAATVPSEGGGKDASAGAVEAKEAVKEETKPVEVKDLAKLEKIDFKDFSIDFSNIQISEAEKPTEAELQAAADSLIDACGWS